MIYNYYKLVDIKTLSITGP